MDGWTDRHEEANSHFSQLCDCTTHTQCTSVNKLPTINKKSKNGRNQYSKLVGQEYHMTAMTCKSNPHLAIKCFASNFFLIFLALYFFLTFTHNKGAASTHSNSMRQMFSFNTVNAQSSNSQSTDTYINTPACMGYQKTAIPNYFFVKA
jgi:ATP-dependent Zn protease